MRLPSLVCCRLAHEAAGVARGGPRLLLRGLLMLLLAFTGALGAGAVETTLPAGSDARPAPPAGAAVVRIATPSSGLGGAALCHVAELTAAGSAAVTAGLPLTAA